jgi:hypothetical protein
MPLWVKRVRLALLQVVVGVLRDGSIDPHAAESGAVIAALTLNALRIATGAMLLVGVRFPSTGSGG